MEDLEGARLRIMSGSGAGVCQPERTLRTCNERPCPPTMLYTWQVNAFAQNPNALIRFTLLIDKSKTSCT